MCSICGGADVKIYAKPRMLPGAAACAGAAAGFVSSPATDRVIGAGVEGNCSYCRPLKEFMLELCADSINASRFDGTGCPMAPA